MNTENNLNLASTLAQYTDQTFWFIFIVSAFLLTAITCFMVYCCFRFNRKNNPNPTPIHGSILLEVLWTVIPTVIVMVMFWHSWDGFVISKTVPEGAYEIGVEGSQWKWTFIYKDKKGNEVKITSNIKPAEESTGKNIEILKEPNSDVVFTEWLPSMVVPVKTPIKLNLWATDVIHSFSIPAFRVKSDCSLKTKFSKTNFIWFQAKEKGLYNVNCTEFCGTGHSQMNSYVKVVSKEEFDKWLEDRSAYNARVEAALPGFSIYKEKCSGCHTNNGNTSIGPSFLNVLNRKRAATLPDGSVKSDIAADLEYITESIRTPNAKVVVGFPAGTMPTMFADFSDKEIQNIYDYFKTLK